MGSEPCGTGRALAQEDFRMLAARWLVAIALVFSALGSRTNAQAQKVYWLDGRSRTIHRANLDGSEAQQIAQRRFRSIPPPVTVDPVGQKLYWAFGYERRIERSDLDGSNRAVLVSLSDGGPTQVTVDSSACKIYWAVVSASYGSSIQRASCDGTSVETLATFWGAFSLSRIALDPGAAKLYWLDNDSAKLYRANTDGTGIELLVTDDPTYGGGDVCVVPGEHVYWTVTADHRVRRAHLDGSDVEDVFFDPSIWPESIAINVQSQRMYILAGFLLRSATLSYQDIIDYPTPTPGYVYGLSLDSATGDLYWSREVEFAMICPSPSAEYVERIPSDLSAASIVASEEVRDPGTLAIDSAGGRLYWSNSHPDSCGIGTIRRARLDGHGIEEILGDYAAPMAISLDVTAGKVYWYASTGWLEPAGLKRSNLDGTETEDLYDSAAEVPAVVVAPGIGKVYWANPVTSTIQRANLDGTNVETVASASGVGSGGLAVDPVDGKLYWSSGVAVQRADLDGSAVETVVTPSSSGSVAGIAVDPRRRKLYLGHNEWSGGSKRLMRVDLSGSNLETIAGFGVNAEIRGVALDLRRAGDFDDDGDLDGADWAEFAACLGGPGQLPNPVPPVTSEQCLAAFDAQGDGDVDLEDAAAFLRSFGLAETK
jgi:sugar lactone lactonase YvrE